MDMQLMEGCVLSEAQMLENLNALAEIYAHLELEAAVIPAGAELPVPALAAVLEQDERNRNRIVTNSFLPLDREDAEYTKFLQFYMELENDLSGLDRGQLLELLQWVNGRIPVGGCMLQAQTADSPARLAVRMAQGFCLTKPIDAGVFTEELFLFDRICDMVSGIFDRMADGYSAEQIIRELEAED